MRLMLALFLALAGCHYDPAPGHPKPGELPPLPPASGTPIGYLIDSSTDLKLRDDQLKRLEELDGSLAARDAEIDTQLRQIERPTEEDPGPSPTQQKAGMKRQRRNMAPGANLASTSDSNKLHELRNANDRDALRQVWVVLDAGQQVTAKRILEERGVEPPGAAKKPDQSSDDGQPVPGIEP